MIEYTDGQFGAIAPAKDVIDMLKMKFQQLHSQSLAEEIKAVHFGTPEELMKIRDGKVDYTSIRNEIDEMKREMEALKPKGAVKVYQIDDIPTQLKGEVK